MPEIAIIVFDECQASAVSVIVEALGVANLHWSVDADRGTPPFSWRTISWDGRPVQAMGGLSIVPDASMEELGQPDLIFVPAVRSDDPMVMKKSIRTLADRLGSVLANHHSRGGYLAANCSSTFVLAEAGLLNGRSATTSWWLSNSFRRSYPSVRLMPERLVTLDTRVFCAAAFSACLDLGLYIVAEFLGPHTALSCGRVMLIDVNRHTQLPYANLQGQEPHGDDLVLRAQTILLSNIADTTRLEDVAKRLGVTSRTLARRFKTATGGTPLGFLQKARVERAKRLLESTNFSFGEVAHSVGYEDTSSFRRLFIKSTGISPRDYRQRFELNARSVRGQ